MVTAIVVPATDADQPGETNNATGRSIAAAIYIARCQTNAVAGGGAWAGRCTHRKSIEIPRWIGAITGPSIPWRRAERICILTNTSLKIRSRR